MELLIHSQTSAAAHVGSGWSGKCMYNVLFVPVMSQTICRRHLSLWLARMAREADILRTPLSQACQQTTTELVANNMAMLIIYEQIMSTFRDSELHIKTIRTPKGQTSASFDNIYVCIRWKFLFSLTVILCYRDMCKNVLHSDGQ